MKREIKFRAWDGEQMVSPDYIDRNGHANWMANSIPQHSGVHSYPLMQFTGLLDKNGVEIYEGDIVTVVEESMFAELEHTGVVEIRPEAVYIDFPQKGASIQIGEFMDDETTVIGNIYENPELACA